jgi:hypothetical protein
MCLQKRRVAKIKTGKGKGIKQQLGCTMEDKAYLFAI